jgi:hypothetical protein
MNPTAVMIERHGPGGGDGREDVAVPGHDGSGGGRGGGGVVLTVEEERDDAVPRHGGEGWAGGTVPRWFDVEEERGASVEERGTDVEGTRRTRWRAPGGVWWGNARVRV